MCKLTQFPLNTNWQRQVRMFSHSNVNEYDSDLMSNEDDDEDGDDKNKVYLIKLDILTSCSSCYYQGREQDFQRASSSDPGSDSVRPEFDWLLGIADRKHQKVHIFSHF